MTDELNDSLDDIFGVGTDKVLTQSPAAREHIARTTAPGFVQQCWKCRGTGQTRWGVCFACKGNGGKTFKTSPEARAKASAQRADRATARVQEWKDAFKAAEPELWAWMQANCDRFGFANSMLEAISRFGSLTEGQRAAVVRCMERDRAKTAERAERVQSAPVVNATKIETAFATARAKAERPGQMGVMVKPLRLTSSDETGKQTLRFTPGSVGSQWEGMLFVKSEDGTKLGHIKGGRFVRKFNCTATEEAAVIDCVNDPEKAAVAFGKAWSKCGICGHGLLNDESIARGMGPICAEKFGW